MVICYSDVLVLPETEKKRNISGRLIAIRRFSCSYY